MVSVLFFYLSVPGSLFTGAPPDGRVADPNLLYRALKFGLLGSGALVLIWRFALASKLYRELNVFLIAFLALVLVSAAWSIEPAITLTRFVSVSTTFLVCTAFVTVGWHPWRLQSVLRTLFTGFLVASLIVGIVAPDIGKEPGVDSATLDAWRGIFAQKNGLGQAATLGGVFWMHAWLTRETRFSRFIAGFGISLVCLILSRSSTSLISMLFVSMLLILLIKGPGGRRRYVVPFTVLLVALILIYSLAALKILPLDFLLEPIVAITGKDMTFSGRAKIWAVIVQHIKLHPLLGTGYGAYWIGPVPGSPSYVFITRYSDFYPTVSHNGYLDVINDLGYVGLGCLLGYLAVYLRQALKLLAVDYLQGTLYLALFFEEMINNLTETNWFASSNISFVLMTLVTFALARAALDRRLRSASAPLPRQPLSWPRMGAAPMPQARAKW